MFRIGLADLEKLNVGWITLQDIDEKIEAPSQILFVHGETKFLVLELQPRQPLVQKRASAQRSILGFGLPECVRSVVGTVKRCISPLTRSKEGSWHE